MSLDVVDESWRGDQVMENNLNLELASIAPTILVSGLILYLLSSVRSAVATITAAVRARERRTSADRLRMIRRRLLLVERSLQGGAAELQETELPALTLLPVLAAAAEGGGQPPPTDSAEAAGGEPAEETRELARAPPTDTEGSGRSAPRASPIPSASSDGGGGGSAPLEAAAAERMWSVVDEGNRTVLLGTSQRSCPPLPRAMIAELTPVDVGVRPAVRAVGARGAAGAR